MNRQFPALCGIAMLLIVANHTITMSIQAAPTDSAYASGWLRFALSIVQSLGIFAVPVFLFISGTFISYAARGEPSKLSRKFVIRSVGRILWPYLFWSFAFYALVFFHYGQAYSLWGYLKNLLVGYPFHFIPLLMFFYILSPILVLSTRRHALMLILGIGAYQAILLLLIHTDALPAWMQILYPPAIGHTLADWAVFFPLGLIYGLHTRFLLPRIRKIKNLLLIATLIAFVLGSLHARNILALPLIGQLAPFSLVLLLPAIEHRAIPLADLLENVGKRSYGLYLMHLIILDMTILGTTNLLPGLLEYPLFFLSILFFAALLVPVLLMSAAARSPMRRIYRFIFG